MGDVVIQRWEYASVRGHAGAPVEHVRGGLAPPAGTETLAFLDQLRAEGWEVGGPRGGGEYTLRRGTEIRCAWVRAAEYTERLATAKRAAGMEASRAVREAIAETRLLARAHRTRRDADGRTLILVPLQAIPPAAAPAGA